MGMKCIIHQGGQEGGRRLDTDGIALGLADEARVNNNDTDNTPGINEPDQGRAGMV